MNAFAGFVANAFKRTTIRLRSRADSAVTADGRLVLKPASFGDEMFAVGKACDGKAMMCEEARKPGQVQTDPDIARLCGN